MTGKNEEQKIEGTTPPEGQGGEETPFWLQEETPESSEQGGAEEGGSDDDFNFDDDDDDPGKKPDDKQGGSVPVGKHIATKHKLKAKLEEKDEELEKLRKENELLKSGAAPVQQQKLQLNPPKRPRASDFGTDEEYEDALDKYEEQKLEYQIQFSTQNQTQTQKLQQRRQEVEQAVDNHYDRAEKLVQKHSINPEVYHQADKNVKTIIDKVHPKKGEAIFNELVNLVGEGSEIAMFHIGRNKQAAADFENIMRSDPTGLKAAIYLGRIVERSNGAKTQSSRAPAPAAQLKGDQSVTPKGANARRKWQAAHDKGDTQAAFNIKKAARAQGIDTSKWV